MIDCITKIFHSVSRNPTISVVTLTSNEGALKVGDKDGSVQFTDKTGVSGTEGMCLHLCC